MIAEEIEDKSFSEIFDERISQKLNLSRTYYGSRIGDRENEAHSYSKQNEWRPATETDMSIPAGAGAIVSTPADVNKFFYALFNDEVVQKESLERMCQLEDNYGMGLFQIPFYERRALGHNGGIDGFQSNACYFRTDKVNVAYLSNGISMGLNDVLIGILSIYFGKEYNFPSFEPAIEVDVDRLEKYLGIYSSKALPLKITVSLNGPQLMAQATGQGAFPLEAYEENKFRFTPAGIKMEFMPSENKMILNQGGGKYEFTLEE